MAKVPATLVAAGRVIAEPRLAPDGHAIVFSTRTAFGARLVRVVLRADERADDVETALPLDPPPIGVHPSGGGSFDWLPGSDGVVYASRLGLFVARAGEAARCVASAIDPGASLSQPSVSRDGRWVAAVESRDDHDALVVAGLDGAGASCVEIARAAFVLDPSWGPHGVLAWHEFAPPAMPWDDSDVVAVRIEADGGVLRTTPVFTSTRRGAGRGVGRGQPRVAPDGSRVAFVDDSSGWANVTIGVLDQHDQHDQHDGDQHDSEQQDQQDQQDQHQLTPLVVEQHEHATATWGPGQRSFAWSPDGDRIAYVRNEDGFARLCVAAPAVGGAPSREEHAATSEELGKAWHLGVTWARTSAGTDRIAAVRSGATTPPQLVVYERAATGASWERRTVVHSQPHVWDATAKREPETLAWQAPDGATLHARIYRATVEPAPTIVSVHGGPTGQTTVEFDARTVFWLERGWSVLVPDYRGSTGWGRAYQQALNTRWGELDVADTASAIEHAIGLGLVDPARVVAMGGSAGGFTVLGLLAAQPQRCAAGVALYAVADLIELDAKTHRFERHYNSILVGPRPATEDRYHERSPINWPERVTVPLLLFHGDADEVVSVDQSRRLYERLRALGRDVELHVYAGEGHGWRDPAAKADELERTEAFFARVGLSIIRTE